VPICVGESEFQPLHTVGSDSITVLILGEKSDHLMRTLNEHPQRGYLVRCLYIECNSDYEDP